MASLKSIEKTSHILQKRNLLKDLSKIYKEVLKINRKMNNTDLNIGKMISSNVSQEIHLEKINTQKDISVSHVIGKLQIKARDRDHLRAYQNRLNTSTVVTKR